MRQRSLGLLRPAALASIAMALVSTLAAPALAQSPTPSEVPQAPPSALTVTTTYPSIEVDPGGEATFPLSVTSPTPERVDLSVTTLPEGFTSTIRGGGSIVGSVTTTGTAESPELELSIEVPDTTPPGTYNAVLSATAQSGSVDVPVDLIVADISGGGATLTTEFPQLEGTADADTSFDVTLTNDTSQEITFALQGQGEEGWTVEVHPSGETAASTVAVAAGDDQRLSVTVTPSRLAAAGPHPVRVAAASDVPNASPTLDLVVVITGSPSMDLSTQDGRLNATVTAGGTSTLTLALTNTGSEPLTAIAMAATPPRDWEVTFEPATVDVIDVGQVATVTARITPTANAVAGDYQLTVRASNPAVNESVQIRTTVETSSIWGLVGIALIAIVLIGLFLVFRRYGRR
jgi:uncharacterized membrane protein